MVHWRGDGKPLQYSCHDNPMNCIKKQKDMIPKDESPWSEGVKYATGEEQKTTTNTSKQNEVAGSKWKRRSVVDVSGGESKI